MPASSVPADAASPQPKRPTDLPIRIPSYAQPRHLNRRQPPILEQVRTFVEQFGSKGDERDTDRMCSSSYYTGQLAAASAMTHGTPSSGGPTTGMIRRQQEHTRVLANMSGRKHDNGAGGGPAKTLRQLRERMHRATQGLPTTPLPSKLLTAFGARDPSVEPDGAEFSALSWLGLRRLKKCGLCSVAFPVETLVTSVSVKALVHLRKEWSIRRAQDEGATKHETKHPYEEKLNQRDGAVDAKSRVPAHAYNETRVCRFCAQFFGVFLGERFEECTTNPASVGDQLQQHRRSQSKHPMQRVTQSLTSNSDSDVDSEAEEGEDTGVAPSGGNVSSQATSPNSRSSISNTSRSSSTASASSNGSSPDTPNRNKEKTARPSSLRGVSASVKKALGEPVRQVVATRSSLLRRTHHHFVKQGLLELAKEDSRDVAVVEKRKNVAAKAVRRALKPQPVCAEFVLGPSSDEEQPLVDKRVSSDSPSLVRASRPHTQPDETCTTRSSSPFSPLSDRHLFDDTVHSALAPETSQEAGIEGMTCPWSGSVRVLVMCCNAYRDRLAMPAATPQLATRLAHWCSQVFYNSSTHDMTENVQILLNDDVTPRAIGTFLQDCAEEHAAPLMFFIGLVEHVEGCFGDVTLHMTNSALNSLPNTWPAHCSQWLPSSQEKQSTKNTKRSTPKRKLFKPLNHPPQAVVNPLQALSSSPTSSPGSSSVLGVSLQQLASVCEGLDLPHPTLVLDCCFGPLVLSTHSMIVVHPARPAPTTGGRVGGSLAAGIPSGQVLSAFVSMVEGLIRQKTPRGNSGQQSRQSSAASQVLHSCSWSTVAAQLLSTAEVGVAAQELFHNHLADDNELRPFVVTGPLHDDRQKAMLRNLRGARHGTPLHLPVTTGSNNDEACMQKPLWFPADSTLVELHAAATSPRKQHGGGTGAQPHARSSIWVDMNDDDFDIFQSAAARVSQTFCLRLHPRLHNTQRMTVAASQHRLAESLRLVLRSDPATRDLDGTHFNISVVLTGHVAIFLSSEDQLHVQHAASVLVGNVPRLLEAGYTFVDYGFVVARTLDCPLSFDRVVERCGAENGNTPRSSITILDVHVN